MRRKIAWFAPLPPEPTEIPEYTARLHQEIEQEFDVSYFAEVDSGFLCVATDQRYRCRPGGVPHEIFRAIGECDVAFYEIGDDPKFHLHTLFLSRAKPGIIVLHNHRVHSLIEKIYKDRLGDREGYITLMQRCYGNIGAEAAAAIWAGKLPLHQVVDDFPLTEVATANALALIVHSEEDAAAIRRCTSVPVFRLPPPDSAEPREYVAELTRVTALVEPMRLRRAKLLLAARLGERLAHVPMSGSVAQQRHRACAEMITELLGNAAASTRLAG